MSNDADYSKSVRGLQDSRVDQLRTRPDASPTRLSLSGLLGDSDRPGHRRLYFSPSLDYYVEFHIDDVLATVTAAPMRAPFDGVTAAEVTLRRDAEVSYTRAARAQAPDEFDIDLRKTPRAAQGHSRPAGRDALAEQASDDAGTCDTCDTCAGQTCEATCAEQTCHDDTCQDTCQTCPTDCGCTQGEECTQGCTQNCSFDCGEDHTVSCNPTACDDTQCLSCNCSDAVECQNPGEDLTHDKTVCAADGEATCFNDACLLPPPG
jgi:hypothetical protein